MGTTAARRQTIDRPRRASLGPMAAASPGSVPSRWFGTMSAGSANQNRDSPVSTRPLSGIAVGRTTSNADSRSDATRSSRSASSPYRSRTLPERTNRSAASIGDPLGRCFHLERVEARDHLRYVAQERRVVKARVELLEAELAGDHGFDRQQVAQGPPFVGGAQGRALDDRV